MNYHLADQALTLNKKFVDIKAHPVYISEQDETIALIDALDIIDEDYVDSGKMCDATVIDLIKALRLLCK